MAPNGAFFTSSMTPFGNIALGDVMYFERLKLLRENQELTQQEIADLLNMHRSVYRRYETGEREIPVWAVIKLAQVYHKSTDYILGLSDK